MIIDVVRMKLNSYTCVTSYVLTGMLFLWNQLFFNPTISSCLFFSYFLYGLFVAKYAFILLTYYYSGINRYLILRKR